MAEPEQHLRPVTDRDPVEAVLSAVAAARPRCGPVRVVAVDGGAASGKSTLAATLAAALAARLGPVTVLHTDDLLDGWDDQYDFWPRLRSGVLDPLSSGRTGRYRRYDWVLGAFAEWCTVPVTATLLVEGVSSIEACGDRLSIGVWLDIPRAERERRWRARDGELSAEAVRWLDREDLHRALSPAVPVIRLDLATLRL